MNKAKASRGRTSSSTSTEKMQHPGRSNFKRPRDGSDWDLIVEILDAGLVAHVGFCSGDQMFVIPMTYSRDGNTLFLHGSVANRLLRALKCGAQVCVTVTLIDRLVLSRSGLDLPTNYCSVVAFGQARIVAKQQAKLAALRLMSEHSVAGRCPEVSAPSTNELNATTVLKFSIDEASAKVRRGPSHYRKSVLKHPVWAGILPLQSHAPPIPDDSLCAGTPIPEYVLHYIALQRAAVIG
jgi:uncharacterized protein